MRQVIEVLNRQSCLRQHKSRAMQQALSTVKDSLWGDRSVCNSAAQAFDVINIGKCSRENFLFACGVRDCLHGIEPLINLFFNLKGRSIHLRSNRPPIAVSVLSRTYNRVFFLLPSNLSGSVNSRLRLVAASIPINSLRRIFVIRVICVSAFF